MSIACLVLVLCIHMPVEIYWKLLTSGDTEVIPGKVSRLVIAGREARLTYEGRQATTGHTYSGVIRLKLRTGIQTIAVKQLYNSTDEPITVTGEFEDDRLENFFGNWLEPGVERVKELYEVEILGLPPQVGRPRKPAKTQKLTGRNRKRRLSSS